MYRQAPSQVKCVSLVSCSWVQCASVGYVTFPPSTCTKIIITTTKGSNRDYSSVSSFFNGIILSICYHFGFRELKFQMPSSSHSLFSSLQPEKKGTIVRCHYNVSIRCIGGPPKSKLRGLELLKCSGCA